MSTTISKKLLCLVTFYNQIVMNIVGGTVLDEEDIHGMAFNGIAGDRMVRLYSGAHEECRRSVQEGAYGKG